MASDSNITVTVVFSPRPREAIERRLQLSSGSSVEQAIAQSRVLDGLSPELVGGLECGVWGRKAALQHVLRDGDRVELYRPLQVDPKEARRLRFAGQGSKVAGLFRKKRQGAKAGY